MARRSRSLFSADKDLAVISPNLVSRTARPRRLLRDLLVRARDFDRCKRLLSWSRRLQCRERTDCDVVSVRIPQRELLRFSARVYVRLLVESGDKSAGPLECHIEIIDTKKQE
ncbi:MAG: hypothetical protein JWO52_3660 [Gammaproteobacteria bacterium]|jgi:hypothetical protein|nr:hypothetical protein [Gammaproteobacteria bacterium]